MLYSRDYSKLTDAESVEYQEIKRKEGPNENSQAPNSRFRRSYFFEYPKAARHFISLFPNNYLDQADLSQQQDALRIQAEKYNTLLNVPNLQELEVKAWIKENEAYHIVGSILKDYNFGHHGAYLFTEFPIGTSYKADYLIVGQNSDGYHHIFCEFESVSRSKQSETIVKKDGNFGSIILKGLAQIDLWKNFLQSNFNVLENDFLKYKNPKDELPIEFRKFKQWQINYVVVAGRRNDYTERSRELRTQYKSERNIQILHYDNLYSNIQECIGRSTY
jgi:hypothetical protein